MSFAFALPTTSHLPLSQYLRCDSHPSLTLAATSSRTVLRQSLKTIKALPANSPTRGNAIQAVLAAVHEYLPYALALDSGLSGQQVGGEEVVVALTSELEVEWRCTLAPAPHPGRRPPRIPGRGLDYEILFVLVTGAYAHCLEARLLAATFHRPSSQTSLEQKKAGINSAVNALLAANSILVKAQSICEGLPAGAVPSQAVDVQPATLNALAELCLASATLLAVVKDDDYLTLVAQARDSSDKEWMYKAPDIPKVRANLFVRVCIAASDHAAKAVAMLGSTRGAVRDDLVKYAKDLQATCRARACRFSGVDAELSGKMGEALGWLNAARRQLGLPVISAGLPEPKSKFKPSLTQMKKDWSERKERKGVESKASPTWDDAGKIEEGRVLEMLQKTWSRTNDVIHHHIVADDNALVQNLPGGREFHKQKTWTQPVLESGVLEGLRAPPEGDEDDGSSDASGDEIEGEQMPGGYPSSSTGGDSGYY